MAKRRRRPPKPQARPSGRELWEQQQASAKRLVESPFFRSLQEHNRHLRDSPLGRSLLEDARPLRDWQERSLRAPDTPREATAPSAKRRKEGRGRKPSLNDAEIGRLQAAYPTIRQDKPTLKQTGVFDALRALLPKDKRSVSDTTLRDRIVRPRPRK
jgi:hypothetical protein